ncbi:neuronal acetylcholine receptor subunit beta-3-like [Glandiceps talaboti]
MKITRGERLLHTYGLYIAICMAMIFATGTSGATVEEKLQKIIFKGYEKYIRPVPNISDTVLFNFSLSITQILDVDEKNQRIELNVWLDQQWEDYRLVWDPEDYGGLEGTIVPFKWLWYPDLVLDNSIDGTYSLHTWKYASVYSDGTIWMTPPGTLKSACYLNIRYFPFDVQYCDLTFGPWEYTTDAVLLVSKNDHIVKENYIANVEWDFVNSSVVTVKEEDECCPGETYSVLTYTIVMRRRPLYYVINIIIPGGFMALLTILVFYLPPESGEKISLTISLLIALSVFTLIIADIMPPTSETVPLIGQYFLFNMAMVTMSLCISILVINIHSRSGKIHKMNPRFRKFLFYKMAKYLCISNSWLRERNSDNDEESSHENSVKSDTVYRHSSLLELDRSEMAIGDDVGCCKGKKRSKKRQNEGGIHLKQLGVRRSKYLAKGYRSMVEKSKIPNNLSFFEMEMLKHAHSLLNRLKSDEGENTDIEDWRFLAVIIDRIFMITFAVVILIGTCALLFQPPYLWK